jgi:hypothetical protein
MRYVDELRRHGTVIDHVGCAAEIVRLYEENVRLTAPQPQPRQDMDAFRLGYDKGADDTRRRDHERINDEALLRQALEALEACCGWPQTIEALRERLK